MNQPGFTPISISSFEVIGINTIKRPYFYRGSMHDIKVNLFGLILLIHGSAAEYFSIINPYLKNNCGISAIFIETDKTLEPFKRFSGNIIPDPSIGISPKTAPEFPAGNN